MSSDEVGRRVGLRRVPEGAFFVARWWIRMPLVQQYVLWSRFARGDRTRYMLAGYGEESGEVVQVTPHARGLR